MWRALRDGADKTPVLYHVDGEGNLDLSFRATGGCTISDAVISSELQIAASLLTLEHPLRTGETAITEYVHEFSPDLPADTFYQITTNRRAKEVMIWVEFHPDLLPTSVEAYRLGKGADEWPLDVTGRHSFHHYFRPVPPGSVGIRWAF